MNDLFVSIVSGVNFGLLVLLAFRAGKVVERVNGNSKRLERIETKIDRINGEG